MTKQDFILELRMVLSGKLDSSKIDAHARYYEEYINAEVRNGKSEKEVLEMLGNPRLIARSILDAEGVSGNAYAQDGATADESGSYSGSNTDGYLRPKKIVLPSWLLLLLVVLTILAVIGIVVAVVWWLAPMILVIWLIVFLVKTLNGKR